VSTSSDLLSVLLMKAGRGPPPSLYTLLARPSLRLWRSLAHPFTHRDPTGTSSNSRFILRPSENGSRWLQVTPLKYHNTKQRCLIWQVSFEKVLRGSRDLGGERVSNVGATLPVSHVQYMDVYKQTALRLAYLQ